VRNNVVGVAASKHVTDRTALLKGLRVFGIMDENMFIIFAPMDIGLTHLLGWAA